MELALNFELINFSFSMNWQIMLEMENNVDRETLKMMAEKCYRDIFIMSKISRLMKVGSVYGLETGSYLFPRNYDFVGELYDAFVERIEYYEFQIEDF